MKELTSEEKILLSQYAVMKISIKELEEQQKLLAPRVIAIMQDNCVDKIEAEAGTFAVENRRTWKFSPQVDILSEELKKKQEEEKAEGIAIFTEQRILRFTGKKAE